MISAAFIGVLLLGAPPSIAPPDDLRAHYEALEKRPHPRKPIPPPIYRPLQQQFVARLEAVKDGHLLVSRALSSKQRLRLRARGVPVITRREAVVPECIHQRRFYTAYLLHPRYREGLDKLRLERMLQRSARLRVSRSDEGLLRVDELETLTGE